MMVTAVVKKTSRRLFTAGSPIKAVAAAFVYRDDRAPSSEWITAWQINGARLHRLSIRVLRIENHRLFGDHVSFRASPNCGGELKARFLVFHYTAGRSAASSIESLCTRKPSGNASAHLVLSRDGRIVQLVPFDVVAWHAGTSHWNGLVGLNRASIGIELDNAGALDRVGDKFIAWFGSEYGAGDVMLAEHKHGGGTRPWHAYTEAQIERALELAQLLVEHYGLEGVLGHEDIARGRKQDPGPAFPLEAIASRALAVVRRRGALRERVAQNAAKKTSSARATKTKETILTLKPTKKKTSARKRSPQRLRR